MARSWRFASSRIFWGWGKMTTLIEDIAAALTAAGYTDLRAYRFDSSKTDQICIIQGGGSAYIVTGGDIEKPNIQIQVRDNNLANAEAKAEAIKVLLHKNDSITDTVAVIWDGRAPDYWADDNGLHIFSIEFKVTKCRT